MRILPPPISSVGRMAVLAACAIAVSSCADTAPEIPQDELYLRGFIKQFGVPDADHTWSMATAVEADVRLDSRINGMAMFYATAPESPDCKVLGSTEIVNGRGSQRFDVRCGTDMVYVRVANSKGMTEFSGFVASTDGHIAVTTSASRADGDCPVTVTEVTDYMVKRMDDAKMEEVKKFIANHPKDYLDKTWKDICTEQGLDQNRYPSQTFPVKNLYKLNDVATYTERTEIFPFEEVSPIIFKYTNTYDVRTPGPFSESYDSEKKADNINKYYHQEKKLDAGAETVVEHAGPVTLDLMWKGSQEGSAPILGYYYYLADDTVLMNTDPLAFFEKVPKFILFDKEHKLNDGNNDAMRIQYCKDKGQHYNETDANPQYNNDPCYLKGEHDYTGQAWEALNSSQSVAVTGNNNFFRGANMQGLHIKLVYRGDDGKGESTFDFPEGMRIGFFSGTAGEADKFYLSNAALNFYLFAYNYTQLGFSEDEQTPMTLPTAARFSFNGGNYLGMETERDFDLNDLVFRISNAEPAPDITPQDFPKEADPEMWILACEDLGSTKDYDFNDVVLKVGVIPPAEAGGETKVKIVPIACGGTLDSYVYFRKERLGEIHNLLGMPQKYAAGAGNGTPDINHSNSVKREFKVEDGYLLSDKFKEDFSVTTTLLNGKDTESAWYKRVETEEFERMNGKVPHAPQMLLLHPDWSWPVEHRDITVAYPGFKDWTHDIEKYDWIYNTPNQSYIYNRTDR